jgi:hypothetical protein
MDTKAVNTSVLYVYPIHVHYHFASYFIVYHAKLFVEVATRESLRYGLENGTLRRRQSHCRTRSELFCRLSSTRSTTVAHSTMTLHSSFWTLHSQWLLMCSQFVCPSRMQSLMADAALLLGGEWVLLVSPITILPSN